jgi:hypothetical protein
MPMLGVRLNFLTAEWDQREPLRAARRATRVDPAATPVTRVSLRFSGAADSAGLRRLAALDSAPAPSGTALVAEVDGRLRAALPLDGSAPIADPFHAGDDLIELLRLRAAQLGRR